MILPNNGKVVIIDDQPEDVIELISALSREKVPFLHYKEMDLSDLPETPIENVRLIFLDLELLTDTYMSTKNITAPIKTRLSKILQPNTPYALVIWSRKESDYKEALLTDFTGEFIEYKPVFYTSLPKADIIGKAGALNIIKAELEKEILKFKSFNAFLVWESIVNESAGKLTNDITRMYPLDEEWDTKTQFLLYKLAFAYSGKAVNSFDSLKQLKKALYTLTMTFSDNIENLIDKIKDDRFLDLVQNSPQQIKSFTPIINKLLLISESSDDNTQPGNLFFPLEKIEKESKENDEFCKLSTEKIQSSTKDDKKKAESLAGLKKNHSSKRQELETKRDKLKKVSNEIINSALNEGISDELSSSILKSAFAIEIVVTPMCDYAQVKTKLSRILPGIIVPSKYRINLNVNPAYVYISDADIKINSVDSLFIFDFRFLYSKDNSHLKGYETSMRLKQQFLSDIQIKLGAHVNRSGILYVS